MRHLPSSSCSSSAVFSPRMRHAKRYDCGCSISQREPLANRKFLCYVQRQRLKLQYEYNQGAYAEQPAAHSPATTHDMDLLMEQLSTCSEDAGKATAMATATAKVPSDEPRVSILLKIRHQIFERKRQRQRQLAELVKQRLVVWRPW